MSSPNFAWLLPYVPVIAIATAAAVFFALGVMWLYFQHSPGQSRFADPDTTWELYKAHAWRDEPGEEELSAQEFDEWDAWQDELDQQEQQRLAEINAEYARRQALAARLAEEQAQINRDFPQWLIEFGASQGLDSYAGLVRLVQWINHILAYCHANLDSRMPIRPCYQAAQGGYFGPAPNSQCCGRTFFELLSKALVKNGLLSDGRGTQGRQISPDARLKLHHPQASSVQ